MLFILSIANRVNSGSGFFHFVSFAPITNSRGGTKLRNSHAVLACGPCLFVRTAVLMLLFLQNQVFQLIQEVHLARLAFPFQKSVLDAEQLRLHIFFQ